MKLKFYKQILQILVLYMTSNSPKHTRKLTEKAAAAIQEKQRSSSHKQQKKKSKKRAAETSDSSEEESPARKRRCQPDPEDIEVISGSEEEEPEIIQEAENESEHSDAAVPKVSNR
jgi:hypothetical protein